MPSLLITNIRQLVNVRKENQLLKGNELSILPCIENAWLVIEDGIIAGYGEMSTIQSAYAGASAERHSIRPHSGLGGQAFNIQHTVDAKNQFVLPCWCDSHTHLVFSGSRENEFVNKIKGM